MSVFGFIENFFFISLALVFALVLFLVYHFKNRITVAEKKSESMYGLLTAVVKEIKTLRGMFGLGGTAKEEHVKQPIEQPTEQPQSNNFATFVKNEPREVITIGFTEGAGASLKLSAEDKIVVSDVGSDEDDSSDDESELSEESGSSSETETETDEEEGALPEHLDQTGTLDIIDVSLESIIQEINTVNAEEIISVNAEEIISVNAEEIISVNAEEINTVNAEEIISVNAEEINTVNAEEINTDNAEEVKRVYTVSAETEEVIVQEINLDAPLVETDHTQFSVETSSVKDSSVVFTSQRPSVEQLRKMNINQLKTIASQFGISTDTSKMKKHELISLIREDTAPGRSEE